MDELQKFRGALERIEKVCSDVDCESSHLDDLLAREKAWQIAAPALGHPDPFEDDVEPEDEDEEEPEE